MNNFARWVLTVDGDKKNEFDSKFAAVEAAAEELELSEKEMFELMADGWLPLGEHGSVTVANDNDNNY
jgi:hypothetical protein